MSCMKASKFEKVEVDAMRFAKITEAFDKDSNATKGKDGGTTSSRKDMDVAREPRS
jgi:hypothetical protein